MISVIVPVYNVEKYISRCVDSILGQSFSDFELLLVDDASTDSSGTLCDEIAESDPRIRVIHKEHSGLSCTRNRGIEEAKGESLCFIDSDDYIASDMLETLNGLTEKYDADLACCAAVDVFEGKTVTTPLESKEFCCGRAEAFDHVLRGVGLPSACNKLFRRSAISDVRFPAGKLYEDGFFTPEVLMNIERMGVTTKPLYYYFRRADSITTKPFCEGDLDIIEAYERCIKMLEENCREALPPARFRLAWAHFNVLDKMLVSDDYKSIPQLRPIVKYLRGHAGLILTDKGFGKMRKLSLFALMINVGLYRAVCGLKQKIYKIQ